MTDTHLISEQFLLGGGQMSAAILDKDWAATPLGPISAWPQSLRTTVSLCLASNFPISIAWGPQRNQIYNDGYWPICGAKHPSSMGQDFKECWLSAWPVVGKAFEQAEAGQTSYLENQRMFLDRNGYLEEAFFTFSFSPIRDETGKIGGIFHPVTETTARMLSERRTHTLRDLVARTAKAQSVQEVYAVAIETLAMCAFDLPFALLYVFPQAGEPAQLAGAIGIERGLPASPMKLDMTSSAGVWPVQQAVASGETQLVESLDLSLESEHCPYPEAPAKAFVLPLRMPGMPHVAGLLIAGVSPRLPLDEAYRNFFELLAAHLGTAMANARAYEEERRRAEALAELDRAKTTFFSNVSHEFRTPLTLMLGPLEDILARPDSDIPVAREEVESIHRNGLRLLRLVNGLLDFSRLEAGRVKAFFEPLDLCAMTAGLAGVFRSAIEKAGLRLIVDCAPLPSPVYVDRDMWEKIVLNLLSNAFKFTFEGEICVRLKAVTGGVELLVSDTGTGIPPDEVPRLFERFHRVENARSRTDEGSSIGLSLMYELVKLHGGAVHVRSKLGSGSAFVVFLPFGAAHLPAEQISQVPSKAYAALSTNLFVEEALRWLPQESFPESSSIAGVDSGSADAATAEKGQAGQADAGPLAKNLSKKVVLLADDNADMRAYVQRLLRPLYEVVVVTNGREAVEAARQRMPDLIVSDVMMPQLDGFGVIAELRRSESTEHIPVILLSARAGEEAQVEGLEAGADDYIVKPFSARELLARVRANLELAQLRQRLVRKEAEEALRESWQRYAVMVANAPGMIFRSRLRADNTREFLYVSEGSYELLSLAPDAFYSDPLTLRNLVHPDDRAAYERAAALAFQQQEEWNWQGRVVLPSGKIKTVIGRGHLDAQAKGERLWNGLLMDVTERIQAEQKAAQLAAIVEGSVDAIKSETLDGIITSWNQAAMQMYGYTAEEMLGQPLTRLLPPDRAGESKELLQRIARGEAIQAYETVRVAKDGTPLDIALTISPIKDATGKVTGAASIDQNICHRKEAQAQVDTQILRIEALRNIDMAISASLDLRVTLNVLLDQVTNLLHVDSANVLLFNPRTHRLEYAAGRGFRTTSIQRTRQRIGEGHAGRAALERRVLDIPNLKNVGTDFLRTSLLADEGFVSYWVAPLITKGRVEGVLELFHRSPLKGGSDWVNFLEVLAGQAAIAIENAALFDDLQRSNLDLQIAYDSTLEGWSKALDLRDRETEGHTLRVTEGTMTLASALNIYDEALVQMRRGALLHDIGKMGIPDSILLKPGPLSPEEWGVMKLHPDLAYNLLAPIPYLQPALDIPYCHHEKWDGSGYPRGLKREHIPLSARIFAVVDVWDALRSDRPYRKGWTAAQVRDHIAAGSGSHFDPHVVEVFLNTDLNSLP